MSEQPTAFWAVALPQRMDQTLEPSFWIGLPIVIPKQWFIPLFETEEEAIEWRGDSKCDIWYLRTGGHNAKTNKAD